MDDIALLKQFAETNSESAFAEIVSRHLNLAYSTALRSTGNAHAAQEISQAVFIILARKAKSLGAKTILSGWLYQTTRLTAANYLRTEIRRRNREQEAYMQSILNESESAAWLQIAPLLEDAMARLGEKDRNAVVLRFFENKNLREVGAALGASEDAAKMRVNRALEKLRKIFAKRGVALSATIIAGAVSANSVHAAPIGLAATISATAVKSSAVAASTLTLVKGALKIMAWTKTKTAIVTTVIVILTAGTTTVTVKEIRAHETYHWQVRNANSDVLRRVPPQVKIAHAKYPEMMGSGSVSIENGKTMGVALSAEAILEMVYGQSPARTIFLDKAPPGKYDYIANLRSGNEEALKNESKRIFGLAGRRETRETDVLLLKIQNPNATGLKSADPHRLKPHEGSSSSNWGAGYYSSRNQTLSGLAWFLEDHFKVPVIDQTELTNHFDIDLNWDETNYQHPNLENLRQAILTQLGLELVPTHMPIEMLVVEKSN